MNIDKLVVALRDLHDDHAESARVYALYFESVFRYAKGLPNTTLYKLDKVLGYDGGDIEEYAYYLKDLVETICKKDLNDVVTI